ncbi:MAG: hypothetical protein LV481_05225 [Methylacidiphilales bacterium]|nr:hypothetical protein [Candidatus Methylacidiphilales bacterium]
MKRMILLLALLLPAPFCSAQILIQPNPHATSYMFFAGQPPRAVISPLTNEESGKFRQVYNAALQSNSTLDAEGDALSAQMDAYRKVLIAAMVKADPKVAPLLGPSSGSPLTNAQSDEIRQAQSEVMQADPNLQSDWDELTKKMTEHQQAVDAAMLKLDPSVGQILAKLSP